MNVKAKIIPGAEPFFFPGGNTACLLIHGFTGAPQEMRPLGEFLARKGYTVLGIRLAGHGTNPYDLIRMCWGDWVSSVEDGYQLLKGICDTVIPIGLSMGGVLALNFAADNDVPAVITMATPYMLPNQMVHKYPWLVKLISPFKRFDPKLPKDWQAAINPLEVCYPSIPLRAGVELEMLVRDTMPKLAQITVPALILHAKNDSSIPYVNAEKIHANIGSEDKTLILFEQGGHVICRDGETDQVFKPVNQFIQRVISG